MLYIENGHKGNLPEPGSLYVYVTCWCRQMCHTKDTTPTNCRVLRCNRTFRHFDVSPPFAPVITQVYGRFVPLTFRPLARRLANIGELSRGSYRLPPTLLCPFLYPSPSLILPFSCPSYPLSSPCPIPPPDVARGSLECCKATPSGPDRSQPPNVLFWCNGDWYWAFRTGLRALQNG